MKKTIYTSPGLQTILLKLHTTILDSSIQIGFSDYKEDTTDSGFFSETEE